MHYHYLERSPDLLRRGSRLRCNDDTQNFTTGLSHGQTGGVPSIAGEEKAVFHESTIMRQHIAFAGAIASPALANAGSTMFGAGRMQQGTVSQPAARTPHWERQCGYVGDHARYAPHWVLV